MSPPPLRPMDTDQAAGGQTRPALPASSTGFWALWLDVQTTAAEGVSLTRPRGQLSVFPTGVSETVVLMKKMSWTPPSPPSSGPDGCLFGSRMAPTWVSHAGPRRRPRRWGTVQKSAGSSPTFRGNVEKEAKVEPETRRLEEVNEVSVSDWLMTGRGGGLPGDGDT